MITFIGSLWNLISKFKMFELGKSHPKWLNIKF